MSSSVSDLEAMVFTLAVYFFYFSFLSVVATCNRDETRLDWEWDVEERDQSGSGKSAEML